VIIPPTNCKFPSTRLELPGRDELLAWKYESDMACGELGADSSWEHSGLEGMVLEGGEDTRQEPLGVTLQKMGRAGDRRWVRTR
jgi:hypothetical protein